MSNTKHETAERLASAISAADLDGIVLLSPEAFTYATGVRVPSHTLMRWRTTGVLVTPAGLGPALTVDMEHATLAAQLPDGDVYAWKEFSEDPIDVLGTILHRQYGGGPIRLGIETDFVSIDTMRKFTAALPAVEWLPCQKLVAECRAQKSPKELETLRRLAEASDNALARALEISRAGDTENQIGARIIAALYEGGVANHRLLIVASGPRSQYPNVGPTNRRLEPHDIVRVEVFGEIGGYQAGVARTAVVGDPTLELAKLWSHLSAARSAGLDVLKAGVDPRTVYQAYTDNLGPLRDQAIAFFGHGMGLDLHEPPFLSAGSIDPIATGAVIGVEPFTMLPDFECGLQVKDVVTVTDNGYQMLSTRLDGATLHVIG